MTDFKLKVSAWPTTVAALLLPFLYVPGVYDFTRWPRLLILQIIVLIMFLQIYRNRSSERPGTLIPTYLLAFTLWTSITVFWADNAVEGIFRICQLLTFTSFAYACGCLLDREGIHQTIVATTIAASLVSVICLCQYWGLAFSTIPTAGNPSATFGYRNYLATYLIVVIPPALLLLAKETNRWRSLGFWVAITLMLSALVCTRTRGAWLGLAVSFLVCVGGILIYGDRAELLRKINLRKAGSALLMAAIVIAVALSPARMQTTGQFRFDEQKADALSTARSAFSLSSARGRTTILRNTIRMASDSPLAGVGIGGWQFEYPRYDNGQWVTDIVAPKRPHNDVLWILAETGIVGLLLFTALLVAISQTVIIAWKAGKPDAGYAVALGLGVVAYIVHSLFTFPLERIASSATMYFGVGAIAALQRKHTPRPVLNIRHTAAILMIPLLLASALITWRRMEFDRHYATTVEAWKRQDWHSVRQAAARATRIGPYDFRAFQLLGAGEQMMENPGLAEAAFKRSLDYHPNEGNLPLADLYAAQSDHDKARKHYRVEAALYPNRIAPMLGIAETARVQADWPEVAAQASLILDRQPGHQRAKSLIAEARAAQRYGSTDSIGTDSEAWARRGDNLQASGELGGAIDAYTRAANQSPYVARYQNNLGTILVEAGKPERAVAAYRRAISVDTTYARAYRNLGTLLEGQADTSGAVSAYRLFAEHWRGDEVHRMWAEQRVRKLMAKP